jgi:hypothetical protein
MVKAAAGMGLPMQRLDLLKRAQSVLNPGRQVIPAANSSRTLPSRPCACNVAVRRRAVFVMPEGERPHPWRPYWRRSCVEDAADDDAVGENVEIVVVHSPDGREADARPSVMGTRFLCGHCRTVTWSLAS